MNKYIIELIGTYFLVLVIGLTGNPLAIGAMLMVMIYMGFNVSGAVYNPAVGLGLMIRGKLDMKNLIMFTLFQVVGAFLAALTYYLLMNKTFVPAPAQDAMFIKATVIEIIFTFALVSVILHVATTKKAESNHYYGIAIGSTVLAIAFAGGPISGGAFNPAVGLGPILMDTIQGGQSMKNLPVYIIGPYLGAVLAAIVFKITNPEDFKS